MQYQKCYAKCSGPLPQGWKRSAKPVLFTPFMHSKTIKELNRPWHFDVVSIPQRRFLRPGRVHTSVGHPGWHIFFQQTGHCGVACKEMASGHSWRVYSLLPLFLMKSMTYFSTRISEQHLWLLPFFYNFLPCGCVCKWGIYNPQKNGFHLIGNNDDSPMDLEVFQFRPRPRLLEVVGKAYSVTFREVWRAQWLPWSEKWSKFKEKMSFP